MGRRDHGVVRNRVPEHALSGAPREGHEPERLTFGPGLGFYAVLPLAVVLGGALLYASLNTPEPDPFSVLIFSGMILAGLLFPIGGWTRYRLDEEGIERRTVGGRRRWTWEEVSGVRGVELEPTGGFARTQTIASRHVQTHVRRVVYDPDGRPLFRISPWTKNKRRLATEIRHRATG